MAVKRIVVLGDLLRPDAQGRAGGVDRTVLWLCNAVRRQVAFAAGLPVQPLTVAGCTRIADWLHAARPAAAADRWWAARHGELPDPPAALTEAVADSFCICYEAPPWLIRLLDRLGVPWLDVRLHPVRFLDDLLFAVRAAQAETQAALFGLAVPESLAIATAGLREAMGQLIADSTLPDGTLLVVGQRPLDATQIVGNKFFDALDMQDTVNRICAAHGGVLLKPHPSGDHHSLPIAAANAPARILGATRDNLYRLLAVPQVAAVLTVNSSVAYEAGYFGKQVFALAPLPVRLGWRGDAPDAGRHASLDDTVLCPDFWRLALAPHAGVTALDGMRLPAKPNRLRIALDSFWNFQEIDTDRIPRGPA